MLIAVDRLLRKLRVRHEPTRAAELRTLGRRLKAERSARPTAEEREAAAELVRLKTDLSAALADVTSCGTCARGKRPPRGTFEGGDCCSAVTADLFSDEEVAALVQAGTRPRDLHAPHTAHAGCSFRGATGCTLEVQHRPERCVRYVCPILRRELRDKGELPAIEERARVLKARMDQFVELRRIRQDDEILAPLDELARQRGPRDAT